MKKLLSTLIIFTFTTSLFAADIAYVAKQEGKTVYLDITEIKNPVYKGDKLKLILSEEELKNHKGESLGVIYKYGAAAEITGVEEKYAVAELAEPYKTKQGQKLELEKQQTARPVPAVTSATIAAEEISNVEKAYKFNPVKERLISGSFLNINGVAHIAAAAASNKIKIFKINGAELEPVTEYSVPSYKEIITASAGDIKQTGTAQIFAVIYESVSNKVSTVVFEIKDNKLEQTGVLKHIAKVSTRDGKDVLLGQEIYFHNGLKTTQVNEIVYEKGKFKAQKTSVKAGMNASVFSFSIADFNKDKKDDVLFATTYGKVNLYLNGGKKIAFTSGDFSTTPKRIAFAGNIYRVLLPVPVFKNEQGNYVFAAAENTAKLGIVADSFGAYQKGAVYFGGWNDVTLAGLGKTETDGVIYDLSYCEYGASKGVLATLVYDSDNTVFEIFKLK
ncbi:hypothetical protein [Elusimicrobium minutum]|nr:hypothetical protein [Elusimicrobium minutum]